MSGSAVLLASGLLRTPHAKTSHALIRGPSRYPIQGVIDPSCAGADAGELLDGVTRGIPVFESVREALDRSEDRPTFCIVGVATSGGVLPQELGNDLREAARAGLSLVNGLHQLLGDDPELIELTGRAGTRIIDIRKPRPPSELRFWSGEIAIAWNQSLNCPPRPLPNAATSLPSETLQIRTVVSRPLERTYWLSSENFTSQAPDRWPETVRRIFPVLTSIRWTFPVLVSPP